MGARTVEAVFFRYYDTDNVFAVCNVNTKKLLKRRDVVFHEDVLGHPSLQQYSLQPGFDILGNTIDENTNDSKDIVEQNEGGEQVVLVTLRPSETEIALATLISSNIPEPELELDDHEGDAPGEWEVPVIEMSSGQETHSDERTRMIQQFEDLFKRVAKEYNVDLNPVDIKLAHDEEFPPKSFIQAMRSVNKTFWFQALIAEMRSLFDKGTFGLVSTLDMPIGRKALPTKCVFDIKRDINGTITKFTARWVARGDLQKKGIDYRETFAPVISFPSLRIILTVAAKYDLEIGQLHVISAFLNGLIDTIVYLCQPEGFALDTRVCILHKSIYGLCQAAKSWYDILDVAFEAFGFKRVTHDGALWYKPHMPLDSGPQQQLPAPPQCNSDVPVTMEHPQGNDTDDDPITMMGRPVTRKISQIDEVDGCYAPAYVDDCLIVGTINEVKEVKAFLVTKFKIKDMEDVSVFTGLLIERD